MTYPVGHSAGQDRLDDDAGAPATDDAEAEAGAVVDQVNHLHLRPLCVQLETGRNGGEGGVRLQGEGEGREGEGAGVEDREGGVRSGPTSAPM